MSFISPLYPANFVARSDILIFQRMEYSGRKEKRYVVSGLLLCPLEPLVKRLAGEAEEAGGNALITTGTLHGLGDEIIFRFPDRREAA